MVKIIATPNLTRLEMKSKLIIAGLLLCLAGIAAPPLSAQEQDKKPVGIWRFEETDNQIIDSSRNGNNGKISNDMRNVKRIPGKTGMALQFDLTGKKSGSVVIPDMAGKYGFFKEGITIEAWIKFNPSYKREMTYEIMSNTISDYGKGLRFFVTWEMLALQSGDGTTEWLAKSKPAATPIKPDIWYHVAGVYNGYVFKVYLDGELVGQTEENKTLTAGRQDLYIGSYGNGYAYGFDGIIDEVTVYDYARTDIQILNDSKKE